MQQNNMCDKQHEEVEFCKIQRATRQFDSRHDIQHVLVLSEFRRKQQLLSFFTNLK
jgi:hypothetical protein